MIVTEFFQQSFGSLVRFVRIHCVTESVEDEVFEPFCLPVVLQGDKVLAPSLKQVDDQPGKVIINVINKLQ